MLLRYLMRVRRVVRMALALLALGTLLGVGVIIDMWSALGTRASGERLARMEKSERYENGKFSNALPARDDMWLATKKWFTGGDAHREPEKAPPIEARARTDFPDRPGPGLRVVWLGHSTLIVELDGARILVDPVWGDRCSPSSLYGPTRFHAPPLPFDQLPNIDAVIISHDHYDHLDEPTIRKLAALDTQFIAPLGVGAHLEYWGVAVEKITELDWWEKSRVAGIDIVATPARHFSGRGIGDRDATLWAGYALIGEQRRAFYSGDTAMFPGFTEIGERLGPFDLTMIESGAYDAAWADVHLGPEQAVEAHRMVRGGLMLPVHWGTFNLALHSWVEPIERVLVAAKAADVTVATPRAGEIIEVGAAREVVRWWPEVPWQTATEAPVVSSGLEPRLTMSAPVPE